MALDVRSLVRVTSSPYGSNYKHASFWWYATTDAAATVLAAGYFNNARASLQVNDVIVIMSAVDATGDMLIVKVTAAPATGNVTVAVNSEASGS